MADLIGAFALSHSSLMVSASHLASPDTAEGCFRAFAQVRSEIAAMAPDVLFVVGTDHFNTFSYDCQPQWCIGRAASYQGWADNIPMYEVPGAPELSAEVIDSLLVAGFEPAFSDSMRLDHSFMGPLHFVRPEMDIPVLPLFQNCITRPMPLLRRSYDLGKAIGSALRESTFEGRVVLIGSGGLSHWLGGPEHGRLNPNFDRDFLGHLVSGDVRWLTGFTDDEIDAACGNGGHEIRNWLTVHGAAEQAAVDVMYYEAIPEWFVGASVARFTMAVNP